MASSINSDLAVSTSYFTDPSVSLSLLSKLIELVCASILVLLVAISDALVAINAANVPSSAPFSKAVILVFKDPSASVARAISFSNSDAVLPINPSCVLTVPSMSDIFDNISAAPVLSAAMYSAISFNVSRSSGASATTLAISFITVYFTDPSSVSSPSKICNLSLTLSISESKPAIFVAFELI